MTAIIQKGLFEKIKN